ncbi:unnamed protein product [Cylindrotheca closterium]|uniref:STAS domain-containing protein n=1 Tax=Cylindrotheca closterium TaxID=2856 RepID=A0AAD2D0G9_9STRA|nr:unnamed protein product [Cylindrotheca closterium]
MNNNTNNKDGPSPQLRRAGTTETSSDGSGSTSPIIGDINTTQNNNNIDISGRSANGQHMTVHRRKLLHVNEDSRQNKVYPVQRARASMKESFETRTKRMLPSPKAFAKEVDWLGVILPCTKWMRHYNLRNSLMADVIAGLTVGIMIVPQSMSYAKLAGLPVEYGLYSSLVPVFTYALFGSSRQLAVGPVALISLLLNTGLTDALKDLPVDDPAYQETYNLMAKQVSFLVGIAYLIMGVLRLGFVTIFLSHAVVSGFTTGAAVIIGMSQLKHILGYDIENSKVLHELVGNLADGIGDFNWKTFILGIMSVGVLVGMKTAGKTYPKFKWMRAMGPLTVTVVSIILVVTLDLENQGIPIVAEIPKGLPSFTGDLLTPIDRLDQMWVIVVSITIVGFMESIAIAKQLASKHNYEVDSSMELMGLGMANFVGAMFHSYPVTGSFSRSAVNNEAGAKSGISGLITSVLVAIALLFLTPVFEKLPLAVLASIVLSGVIGLIDYEEAKYLWRVHRFDFLVWLVACLCTMFLGVESGLGIAVGLSLLFIIYESAIPKTTVLGRLPGSTNYRNVKQYANAERYNGIVVVRIDAPIYFANTQTMREKFEKYRKQAEKLWRDQQKAQEQQFVETGTQDENTDVGAITDVKYFIIEMTPVAHIDTSGLHILLDMIKMYKKRGIQICLANPNVEVMGRLDNSGVVEAVGENHIFVTVHDAVAWGLDQLDLAFVSSAGSLEEGEAQERLGDVEEGNEEGTTSNDKDAYEVMQI